MLKKQKKPNVAAIIATVFIQFTSNNTIITVIDGKNKTIISGSCGFLGIKGSRRSTSYASQSIANLLGKKIFLYGIRYICVKTKGFGKGRYSCLKGFTSAGLNILYISDLTSVPFNGCRAPKRRRL